MDINYDAVVRGAEDKVPSSTDSLVKPDFGCRAVEAVHPVLTVQMDNRLFG